MNNMKRERESGGVEIVDVIRDASSSKLELAEEAPSVAEQLPNDNEQFDDEDVNVESTKEALDSYVDAVVTDLDRSRLKYNMVNLYEEAQAQEVL